MMAVSEVIGLGTITLQEKDRRRKGSPVNLSAKTAGLGFNINILFVNF